MSDRAVLLLAAVLGALAGPALPASVAAQDEAPPATEKPAPPRPSTAPT